MLTMQGTISSCVKRQPASAPNACLQSRAARRRVANNVPQSPEVAEQNPQKRIIQPDEVAALAAFLCREEAKGITMENIQITGGALW